MWQCQAEIQCILRETESLKTQNITAQKRQAVFDEVEQLKTKKKLDTEKKSL